MQPNYGVAVQPKTLGDKLSSLVQHLFGMDARIRTYAFGDEIFHKPLKCYFIENGHIYIPYCIPAAEHEIAHMVEMNNPARWTMVDWGMTTTNTDFADNARSKSFFAALSREIRVRAIQDHLGSRGPWLITKHPCWGGKNIQKRLPFGRFKTFEDVELWCKDLDNKTHKAWSTDRIEHEWKTRINHIQNWMETSKAA